MSRAQSDVVALLAPTAPAPATAVAAARKNFEAARTKLAVLTLPVPTAEVTAARAEVGPAGHPQRRALHLGLADNTSAEVIDGLRVGDRVVVPTAAGSAGG